jgi:hypothetical protein
MQLSRPARDTNEVRWDLPRGGDTEDPEQILKATRPAPEGVAHPSRGLHTRGRAPEPAVPKHRRSVLRLKAHDLRRLVPKNPIGCG